MEEDANLAPQMGEGGFQFNPQAGAGGGAEGAPGEPGAGADANKPFEFWDFLERNNEFEDRSCGHAIPVFIWNAAIAVSSDERTLHAVPHSQRACEASWNRKKPENSIMSNQICLQNPALQPASSFGKPMRTRMTTRIATHRNICISREFAEQLSSCSSCVLKEEAFPDLPYVYSIPFCTISPGQGNEHETAVFPIPYRNCQCS